MIEADYMGQLRLRLLLAWPRNTWRAGFSRCCNYWHRRPGRTQLEAVAAVRNMESVRALWSRCGKAREICAQMYERLGIPVKPCTSAAERCARGHRSTATTASQPVVSGADLSPVRTHSMLIGANTRINADSTMKPVASADIIVVDSASNNRGRKQATLIIAFHGDEICWTGVKKLSEIVAGKCQRQNGDTEVTLFNQMELPLGISPPPMKVYALAREKGLGRIALWTDGGKARPPTLVAFFRELAVQSVMQPGLYVRGQFNRLSNRRIFPPVSLV